MSDRDMWKVLHLLHIFGRPGLSGAALEKSGIDCQPDTLNPLEYAGAIEKRVVSGRKTPEYFLSQSAQAILQHCLVANKRTYGVDVRVDSPKVFVVMPFSESWSKPVYSELIEPAVKDTRLECVRGDTTVRVGELTTGIWSEILEAGVVVADVSSPNVNVFYELGLVHALGKDTILLKSKDAELPADFGGAHYYEYSPKGLATGRRVLASALRQWVRKRRALQVGKLRR